MIRPSTLRQAQGERVEKIDLSRELGMVRMIVWCGIKKGAVLGSLWFVCLFSAIAFLAIMCGEVNYQLIAIGLHRVFTMWSGGVSHSLPMITSNNNIIDVLVGGVNGNFWMSGEGDRF